QRYGDAMLDGQVPYLDFRVEYPPAALPVFLLPAIGDRHDPAIYRRNFERLMVLCGLLAIAGAAIALGALRAEPERLLAALGFAGVVAIIFLPFVRLSPGGVWDSLHRQADRPLQIESLGSSFLLVAHQLGAWTVHLDLSHGSQNQGGSLANALAVIQSVVQALVVVALWVAFARGPATPERLVRYSAAGVAAFIAFGKVLSPQFLIL